MLAHREQRACSERHANTDFASAGAHPHSQDAIEPHGAEAQRKQAAESGLNPDVWFENVELIAAKDIGQETVTYVRNIYKYYVAYKLAVEQAGLRQETAKGQ